MADTTLTSKGQTTIPKEIRERLGLEAGDKLSFIKGLLTGAKLEKLSQKEKL